MAAIRETLILEDKFTSTMTQCLQVAQRMANMLDDVPGFHNECGNRRCGHSCTDARTCGEDDADQQPGDIPAWYDPQPRRHLLGYAVRPLAGKHLRPAHQHQRPVAAHDRQRRGGGRSPGGDLSGGHAQPWSLRRYGGLCFPARHGSRERIYRNEQLVAFAEQIQKQMAISGASGASAQAALVQLTQGLASGTLRGEELNSVLEQTPMIAQTIAEYMGVTTGEMRELASEGKVTAEVVKNAMLGAAEETNAQFEQMPMTWAQVWTMFQNVAIQALDPVLDAISWLANNIDLVGPIILGLGAAFGVFLLAANWTNICTAATTALTTAQEMLGAVMATTWGLPLIIIALVIGAIYAVTAAVNHFAGTSVSATGIIAGAVLTVAAIIGNTVIGLLNGIIQAVWSIFVTPFLGIIEWVLNVTNGGFDSFGGAVANLIGNIISWFLDLGKVVTKIIDAIFGTNWTAGLTSLQDSVLKWGKNENAITLDRNAPTIDYRFNYGDAWNMGYNWGANLFSGNGNDAVGAALSGVPYDELSGQLGDIAGSVGSIEKSVKMSDEDIKSLVDVAERRYVNNVNLTAQTPVITVNGANTGRTAADRQSLANAIRDILIEQTASGSTRSTARPASG